MKKCASRGSGRKAEKNGYVQIGPLLGQRHQGPSSWKAG